MDDSLRLMSSMSPKITSKLKPGETRFRRVAGASILALKRNIRRSLIHDKSIITEKNEELNLVESGSSLSSEFCPSLQLKATQEDSIIMIPDSDSSSDLEDKIIDETVEDKIIDETIEDKPFKTEQDCLLPKEKIDAISNWVANVNTENSISSVFTDLSTICGTEIGNEFLPKETGQAVNSTFVSGEHKKFNELFIVKNKLKQIDESISDSMKDVSVEDIIEDSFEVLNRSLRTRLKISKTKEKEELSDYKEKSKDCSRLKTPTNDFSDKWQSVRISEESGSSIKDNKNKVVEYSPRDKTDAFHTPKFVNSNKWQAVEISDDSEEEKDEPVAEDLLDELYGNSWRINKDLVLSKTEPRKKIKKPDMAPLPKTESKPKYSLLYKNPYLDSEKSKSQNLAKSLHKSRLQKTPKSPWMEKLKGLCDSDTYSENSPLQQSSPHKKLDFNCSDDEDSETKSKYFKNNKNLAPNNITRKIRNKLKSTRSNSSSSIENKDPNTKCSKSDTKFKKNPKLKTIKKYRIIESDDSFEDDSENSFSSDSADTKFKKLTKNNVKSTTKTVRNKIIESTESSSTDSDIKVITKKGTPKPVTSTRIYIDSDEEWEEEVSKIERRLTIANDGFYSFLSSLSPNVPLSQCDVSARIFRSNYKTHKDELVKRLFNIYNEEIFDNALPQDMLVEWGDRIRRTAGFCYCVKRTNKKGELHRSARIKLSTKVLDSADRLRDTLIHELCHAATWIINCVSDGHGAYWKAWASKAMKKFPELPPIKTCHNYVINTKYTYKCTGCGYSIGRHSKSLDIERKCCGHCKGKFELLINKINKKGEAKAVAATPKKEATGFALFVKENYGIHKNPLRKHGDVMRILGRKFKELQVQKV